MPLTGMHADMLLLTHLDAPATARVRLSNEDCQWLRQLAAVHPTRPLVPLRTTERLGKLGLIELRLRKLMITDKGRHFLRHA